MLEAGRLLFARPITFVRGVVALENLPEGDRPEVAFAGRSNVGKSSLINALTNRKNLARSSNEPGRTRELNFFDLDGVAYLVDLPGYGYAKASKTAIKAWTGLTRNYLRGRANLKRVFLLVDGRHGLKPNDLEVMTSLDEAAVAYQIVLTKIDKIKAGDREAVTAKTADAIGRRPAAHPSLLVTSSQSGHGIAELRAEIADLGASTGT